MSVLFGIWNCDGKPIESETVVAADALLAPYAGDGCGHHYEEGITLAHHAFQTTAESQNEKQPFLSSSGKVVTWDGRLDNREDLIRTFRETLASDSTDVEIVAASFDRWGTGCFQRLLGDWAIAIWDQKQRELVLAKDFAGIRPLYYLVEDGQAKWSSVLGPLVTLASKKFALDEGYVAGWLAMFPAADRTPYVGVCAVPPCSFVTVRADKMSITKYWDFDPAKRITYRSDCEYEDHFRSLFREAVRRRLRSDRPICAELSGGMDSTSITCMADLIASTSEGIPEILTLSYYDDSEPHGDERPYFAKVEEKRKRIGCHIDLAESLSFKSDSAFVRLTPATVSGGPNDALRRRLEFLGSHGIRVVLSGTGGDEVTGGVPTPIPELQDLLAQREFRRLANKLKLWALAKRKPWFHLLAEAVGDFLPSKLAPGSQMDRPASWLMADFVSRTRYVRDGFKNRISVLGALPSFQASIVALETLRRQMATNELTRDGQAETRYPFLDRTLLEFLFAIPREQIVRPGYRRSLMRRALSGIVPAEVLERRRKAYASRGPRLAISAEADRQSGLAGRMEAERLGIVNEQIFREALFAVRNSEQVSFLALSRTLALEGWLRNIQRHHILVDERKASRQRRMFPVTTSPSRAS